MAARHLRFAHHSDGRRRPYWRDERLLGKHIIDRQEQHVLVIGKDVWSRQEVVDTLHCGNFSACINLSKIAAKLQVDSLEQLVSRFTMEDLFGEVGFGVMTMYVLMCAQEAKKKDPLAWVDRPKDKVVTLATEKHRILKRQHDERDERKRAARAATRKATAAAS